MNATDSNGMRVAKLVCVLGTADTNSNKFYHMVQVSSTHFEATWGRVGGTHAKQTYPMSQWEKIYRDKTKESKKPKPYTDVTDLYAEAAASAGPIDNEVNPSRDPILRDVVTRLLAHANKSIKANYTVSVESVTSRQVERAQAALDAISSMDVRTKEDVRHSPCGSRPVPHHQGTRLQDCWFGVVA
jgi:predicted DNA-binding WGR domain protein